jgi:hypothetical protein
MSLLPQQLGHRFEMTLPSLAKKSWSYTECPGNISLSSCVPGKDFSDCTRLTDEAAPSGQLPLSLFFNTASSAASLMTWRFGLWSQTRVRAVISRAWWQHSGYSIPLDASRGATLIRNAQCLRSKSRTARPHTAVPNTSAFSILLTPECTRVSPSESPCGSISFAKSWRIRARSIRAMTFPPRGLSTRASPILLDPSSRWDQFPAPKHSHLQTAGCRSVPFCLSAITAPARCSPLTCASPTHA